MKGWEFIDGGIRKYHSWGWSEVYADSPEDCFTREELKMVLKDLNERSLINALSSEETELLDKIKEKCRRKR